MGKVRKPASLSNELNEQIKLKGKKKINNKITSSEIDLPSDSIDTSILKITKKKNKLTEDEQQDKTVEQYETIQVQDNMETERKKRKKRRATKVEQSETSNVYTVSPLPTKSKDEGDVKNKKIIFTDDGPQETAGVLNKTESQKTNHKLQGEEAEVKDEDIDRFCEELDEEDNVQFEDWVKQIEEKLNANKKKPKYWCI